MIKILWNVTWWSLVDSSNISEKPVASMSHSNRYFDSDNTISTFLWNIRIYQARWRDVSDGRNFHRCENRIYYKTLSCISSSELRAKLSL